MIKKSDIIIRKGERKDLSPIRDLVIELAVYEKEPHAVTAGITDYLDAFDIDLVQTLIAEVQDKVVGMALYYLSFSTWKGKMMYLEDLYVREDYRYLGIGQLLFDKVKDEATNQSCKILKWQVLNWNTPAINFYEKNKAIFDKDWWNVKIMLD